MMRVLLSVVLMCTAAGVWAEEKQPEPLSGKVDSIEGKSVDLGDYVGKVVLVVNVASKCGFTKQYKELQEIYEKYQDRGFVVLGFPCNQFGSQEPGTEKEIQAFCETKFSVTFPMFSKIDVNGEKAIPLYQYLTSDRTPLKDQGRIKWNFEKFLFNHKGELIARYRSGVKPDAPEVIEAIEAALAAAPAPADEKEDKTTPSEEPMLPPDKDAPESLNEN